MENLIPYLVPAVIVVIVVLLLLLGYVKAPPDMAYIISGVKKKSKVVIGKASIRIPFFERLDKLNLRLIPIDVKTSNAVPTADYINIKLMKTGGIYEAAKIARLAKERGAKVMMGSMLESVVSISAAAHFAMSDENICFYDLDGPLLAKPSSVTNALLFDKDAITINKCIGLGVLI